MHEKLGVVLFDRAKCPIELTPADEAFLDRAHEVLRAAQRAHLRSTTIRTSSPEPSLWHGDVLGGNGFAAVLADSIDYALSVTLRLRQSVTGGHLTAIAEGTLGLALVSLEDAWV
ncbi:MAG: hypothetical protein QOE30_2830 [Mycobacterium sp.]|nr:hypothetical protein [Mycobacterium sp.]